MLGPHQIPEPAVIRRRSIIIYSAAIKDQISYLLVADSTWNYPMSGGVKALAANAIYRPPSVCFLLPKRDFSYFCPS